MPRKYFMIGIVGKAGSGKSTVARILSENYDFAIIDADKIGHSILEEIKELILKQFGHDILSNNGKIDRNILGNIVFKDSEKLKILNSIIHPEIKKKISQVIEITPEKLLVLDAALLFEMGCDEFCDYITLVEAPEKQIIERLKKSRGWDEDKILSILKIQENLYQNKSKIDYIFFNNSDEEKLKKQIEFFINTVF